MSKVSFESFANVIDGKLRYGTATAHAIDPSTGKNNWGIPVATAQDLEDAVTSAKKAYVLWSAKPWSERAVAVGRLGQVLVDYREEMLLLLMKEAGKPRLAAEVELDFARDFFHFYAGQQPLGDEVVQDDNELRLTQYHVPLGVVGAIVPFNFPLALAAGKIAAALLIGNTIIVKPSRTTPYSILKLADIARQFLPPGVFQALSGESSIGPLITKHPGIAKIAFTGSTEAGKKIMLAASETLKAITLELGGNSPSIICPDVDISKIVVEVAKGAFFNSGQFCLASKRIFVHESIYKEFLDAFTALLRTWKAGPAFASDTVLGPVQNKMQYDVPTVIDNPPDSALIVTEEPFGPIVPIQSWKTEDEVIARVNNTLLGLGGTVWSADIKRAERLAQSIESGTIWINSSEVPLPQEYMSGWKESGVGGEWGRKGLFSYCQVKTVHHYKTNVGK
ncbi:hypothetical protein B7463_g5202, partial [Scytalidium lignicola]